MKILVATGGATHSTQALRFAAELAAQAKVPLVVLTVVKQPDQQLEAESILIGVRALIGSMLPPTDLELKSRVGHPAEEILAELEDDDYAAAILGEKQHYGLITRFVIGSTAHRVVEHAPCPIILAKGAKLGPIQQVLICESGALDDLVVERVREQFPLLLHLVDDVTVLHVTSDGAAQGAAETVTDTDSPESAHLVQTLQRLGTEGVRCSPRLRRGDVVQQILEEVASRDYQLVVIGAHRGGGWRRILLDDIANRLMQKLVQPLLVVR